MVAARRERLTGMLARWAPEQHAEVEAMLDSLARALLAEPPIPATAGEIERHDA
jgi:hypothetical protein